MKTNCSVHISVIFPQIIHENYIFEHEKRENIVRTYGKRTS